MVKYIFIKSPDEWATTKQACRDKRVVRLNLFLYHIYIYLRRQQERCLIQKSRRLMEENSVSFQMFLILLSSITLGSESQISVLKQCQSNT